MGECCQLSFMNSEYVYEKATRTCKLYQNNPGRYNGYKKCDGTVYGRTIGGPVINCNCERVFKTVGLRNLGDGDSRHPVGGFWYSHPHAGQCLGKHEIGHKNCTYKLHDISKAIKAECMYN